MPARKTKRPDRPTRARAPRRARRTRRAPITPESLLELKFVQAGSLAPDGSAYVFPVRVARSDRKGYDSHLHLLDLERGQVRAFTHGRKSDGAPVFSPDGRWIAFTSKRGNLPGIHLLPRDGGEARPLVERDGAFSALSFSPDGTQILCVFRPNDAPPSSPESKATAAPQGAPAGGPATAPATPREAPVYRHITRLWYRLDGTGFLPQAEPQVWLFDIATGTGRQVTRARHGAAEPSFSPDGRRIVYTSNVRPDPDKEMEWIDLFVVTARGGRAHRIPTPPGPVYAPRFSPDGRTIAYIGHDDVEAHPYEHGRPWVVPASGRGQARCLAPRFDRSAWDSTISDMGAAGQQLVLHWAPNGAWVYFLSCAAGGSRLYRVRARGGTPEPVTPERIHLAAVALTRDVKLAVGTVSTATMPPEVFAFDLPDDAGRRMSTLNRAWTAAREVARPQTVWIRSGDGTRVQGWILKPPRFSPRRRYPAIVEVHGGPMAQYGHTFFHEMQVLAARGYVVFYCNPRGSAGYGRAFAEAIRGAWGTVDFADVMAGTDYLERLPYVDGRRIGITGGSYGGYMTNWAVGQTRRYRAAVTQRSLGDLTSFFGSSDVGFRFYRSFGAFPWEDRERYARQSPLTYAHKIRTPLLIIHSENDLRCGIEQAENLFATLKTLGRRVELVRFPEEPHGLSRGGRPDRRLARLERILDWFERYL